MKKFLIPALVASFALVSCARSNAVTGPKYKSATKIAEGKTIYENACNKCHGLFEPEKHTDEEWINTLSRMAPRAKLTNDQHQMVYDYLRTANGK